MSIYTYGLGSRSFKGSKSWKIILAVNRSHHPGQPGWWPHLPGWSSWEMPSSWLMWHYGSLHLTSGPSTDLQPAFNRPVSDLQPTAGLAPDHWTCSRLLGLHLTTGIPHDSSASTRLLKLFTKNTRWVDYYEKCIATLIIPRAINAVAVMGYSIGNNSENNKCCNCNPRNR